MKKQNYFKKKIILLFSILAVGSMVTIQAQVAWEELDPMSQKKTPASCVIDNEIYVFGGRTYPMSTLNSVEIYNIINDEWSSLAPIPLSIDGVSTSLINDTSIIMVGGWHHTEESPHWVLIDSTFIYNVTADKWETRKACPKKTAGKTCAIEGKLYLVGGLNGYPGPDTSSQYEALVYDLDSDTWDTIPNMLHGRIECTANVFNGKIYVFGGSYYDANVDNSLVARPEVYDPGENTWTALPDMPVPVSDHLTVLYNDKFYVYGGIYSLDGGYTTGAIQEYDPSANTWQLMEEMPFQRCQMTGQIVDKSLYIMGGINTSGEPSTIVSEVWKFNLDSLTTSISGIRHSYDPKDNFRIFPNPTSGLININCTGVKRYIVSINSLKGELLYSKETEESSHQIDLSSFQKGIYLMTVRSRDYVRTEKIIKL